MRISSSPRPQAKDFNNCTAAPPDFNRYQYLARVQHQTVRKLTFMEDRCNVE